MLYSLKYEMMVQVLWQFRYSGQLSADILPQAALKDGRQAILIVSEGVITSCFILNKRGQKMYSDAEAVYLLARSGVMDWQLVASPAVSTETAHVSHSVFAAESARMILSSRPRHLPVPQSQMRTWPTFQRSVYLLADGTRSIEQIAILLSRPVDRVEEVMHDLQELEVIEEVS